jgi:hypothetical protein
MVRRDKLALRLRGVKEGLYESKSVIARPQAVAIHDCTLAWIAASLRSSR